MAKDKIVRLPGSVIKLFSLALGCALGVSTLLPWFSLPILGWQIPVPAWNTLGLGLLILGLLHFLRGLGMVGVAWIIRPLLVISFWGWWTSQERFVYWGKSVMAPIQLQLSSLNQGLVTLGAQPISVFDPVQWRSISPGLGWKVCGLALAFALLLTAFDWPYRLRCANCRARAFEGDRCCYKCGSPYPGVLGCLGCGRKPQKNDSYCRSCGQALA